MPRRDVDPAQSGLRLRPGWPSTRDIPPAARKTLTRLLRGEVFDAKFRKCRVSVFRLETLQVYRGSGEEDAIAAFQSGLAIRNRPTGKR